MGLHSIRRGTRYYVCGINNKGVPFVYGPYIDEGEAFEEAHRLCREVPEWEVKQYDTIQNSEATKMWKLEVARKYGDINQAFQRASHKIDDDSYE